MSEYKYRVRNEEFETLSEALDYCEENEIPEDNLELLEKEALSEEDINLEKFCKENPEDPRCKEYYGKKIDIPDEEIPDEDSAITEREMEARVILDNYDKIEDETTKTEVLSVALGLSRGQDKKLPKQIPYTEAFKAYYERAVEKLQDERMIACPICEKLWKTIYENMKENLAEQHKELEVKVPLMRISHIKAKHKGLWRVLKHLFAIPEKKKLPHEQETYTSNPEHCSEKLSREELAEKLAENPELRKEFFRKWMKTLQEKSR